MPISDSKFLSRESIEKNRGRAPADLAELAVHSLELVAELASTGLRFRFKGGNSLLVLLEDPRRFSIDVDIATDESPDRIKECLDECVRKYGVFQSFRHRQHKTKPWLPMTSYELFFHSHFSQSAELPFLMLDVMLHAVKYEGMQKPVQCMDLYRSNQTCEVATVSGILGDKILTLGPHTLGIPLGKKKEVQRLKHVHDIGLLSLRKPVLDSLRESLNHCLTQENDLQQKTLSLEEVLDDTMRFCRIPALFREIPAANQTDPALQEIVIGFPAFVPHLFSADYTWENLQADATRVCLCFAAAAKLEVTATGLEKALSLVPSEKNADFFENLEKAWSSIRAWTGRDYLSAIEPK